ncbi:hypothetical protein Avbf_03093, partial [Armadillidium vulgare]
LFKPHREGAVIVKISSEQPTTLLISLLYFYLYNMAFFHFTRLSTRTIFYLIFNWIRRKKIPYYK